MKIRVQMHEKNQAQFSKKKTAACQTSGPSPPGISCKIFQEKKHPC